MELANANVKNNKVVGQKFLEKTKRAHVNSSIVEVIV